MPPPSPQNASDILRAHARQLAGYAIGVPLSAPRQPRGSGDLPPLTPDQLLPVILGWIEDNRAAVEAAKEAQCASSSPDEPNWDTVFFTLVESVAMYLRKDEEVAQAIRSARVGDQAAAIAHLKASEELIQQVAKALDCTFIQLCDFADRTPDGLLFSSGAYAGLWISNSAEKPFAGVAFKGSSSDKDAWTDINWVPAVPLRPDIAWGSQMHRGFYYNLFGDFTVEGQVQIPFDVVVEQLKIARVGDAKLHFTGHSLGGGLCTLAFGEFLRRQSEPVFANFNIGDVYSLAAPRVCYEPFASEIRMRTQAGSGRYSFRIVNNEDPVPMIPPPPPPLVEDVAQYPFVHVHGAWKITPTGPRRMADEPPPVPPPPFEEMVGEDHDTRRYYASWQATRHS